jgi:hypothetical protein
MQSTLINFNVPEGIRHRFDEVCRASGRTRTSVLVEMMESYVLTQGKALADRHVEIRKVDQTLSEIRQLMGFKEFLAHHASKEQIAAQKPSEPEFSPLSFFDDAEEVEGYWTKYQEWSEEDEFYR